MAISALSRLPAEVSVESELGSDEQRIHLLADMLTINAAQAARTKEMA